MIGSLRKELFHTGEAGTRCLLDIPLVRDVAVGLRRQLVTKGFLPPDAVAIQAIAFDKTSAANWKVTWHQDVMFPFQRPVQTQGFDLPTKKKGVDYARAPRNVLEELLAVRLHLDPCEASNGPLRVSPGSHIHGILRSTDIQEYLRRHGEIVCVAKPGEALLMKPLLLHASSPAEEPGHRRVIHIVYHAGDPVNEPWYRTG